MADALPLVYVASTGRSGSTLLEMLLDTHPELTSVGEFQLLPAELADPAARCGCGRLLRDCPRWGPLLSDPTLAAPSTPLDLVRETRDAGRTIRPGLLPSLLSGRATSVDRVAADYGRANEAALRLVAESAGTTLVDASKDVYRLHLLARSGRFDLRVVHLVRDPRAVVFSVCGPRPRPVRVARVAARWTVLTRLFERVLARLPPERVAALRYEDLATEPLGALAAIAPVLGVDPGGFAVDFRAATNHALAGNPMRGRAEGIHLDDRWRRAMPGRDRRTVWAIAGRTARRVGYG